MKALLVMVCILLASTLFIPTSTMARQLVAKGIMWLLILQTSMIDQCLTLLGGINLLYHVAVECLINPAYQVHNLPRSSPVYPRIIHTAINFHLNLECAGEAIGIGSIGEFVMEYI
ncbi:hypothetical protein ERO13_A01G068001v2 [Gossypium hirsutum]|uniref:Uncharacterized protein n=2 Tax=Gossypium TaxID=3633 RepID=A0A5J5WU53_GOSBA|nr:hypothetical protein ES319_A01G068400v1 [Gossypium barbadense]KAG4213623.1 hypothetical protein ERO13_A01G068001v2 [Gossypium hirsutum]TYH30199.1 hypothetical protein ES288_A01G075200v1 [Gossypium darwinii]